MIDHRYKPSHLPQMKAPLKHILKALKDEGIKYTIQDVNPKKLKPSQGIVFLDKISEIDADNLTPYWVSEEDDVLDGHHRHGSALTHDKPKVKVVKIKLPTKDAIRVLNKIQDIYEYEEAQSQMGVDEGGGMAQDTLNNLEDRDFEDNLIDEDEIDGLEPNQEILHSQFDLVDTKKHKKKISGYRKSELKENSKAGNFFSVKPIDGYIEYNIDFDNLLDTNDFGLTYNAEEPPTKKLAAVWFPHINFAELASKLGGDETKMINRAISKKARKMGYDGIKYGDIIIQGL